MPSFLPVFLSRQGFKVDSSSSIPGLGLRDFTFLNDANASENFFKNLLLLLSFSCTGV
jgi:hypothetical protein